MKNSRRLSEGTTPGVTHEDTEGVALVDDYVYDLYGSLYLSPEQVVELVSSALQIKFTGHHRDTVGGYYSSERPPERFTIERNLAEDEDGTYYLEEEFPVHETLFRVDRTSQGDAIRELLSNIDGLTFLRRNYPSAKARSRPRRSSLRQRGSV